MSAARRLGDRYRVLLADLNAARARERAAGMRDDGYDARSLQCDITDPASVGRLAEAVAAAGPLRAPGVGRSIITANAKDFPPPLSSRQA
jgi:NAD(P)-dependent dehydrogenase (short-subunit alcohol dehydrogenase family)